MRVSELVAELEKLRAEHGDLELKMWDCYNDAPAEVIDVYFSLDRIVITGSASADRTT